ncbi:MAG: ABC transporter substrate-binding protein [Xanthobacteraceae bacterium]|jgi:putative tryptophan/tyrosine transport system substrate-binding protein
MRRREFIALIAGAAVTSIFAAHAQQRVRRIGVLLLGGPEFMGPYRDALRDLGYVEGKNIQLEVRSADGQANRLPAVAAELVRSKVDVIVASLTPAVIAAKNATRDVPIVMAPAGDPVATGLIANLARPGANVTGLSATGAELSSKNLELIREIVPTARRVAVLGNYSDPFTKPYREQIQKGAQSMRLDVQSIVVRGADELDSAFAAMARERADAVVVQGSLPIERIVALALKHRLPAVSHQKFVAQSGALASYSASIAERGREIAAYVDKILKGAKPADLPVQQPTKFELVINLKTARALGLEIPPTLLARADEVIE